MDHPLVGKTITWTWESPFPGSGFEVHFLSSHQKRSIGKGAAAGYDALHTYDAAIVAPNTYLIAWIKDDGDAVSVVLNLDEMQVYGSYITSKQERVFMLGVIDQVSG
jgi:hypothetical protein